MRLKEIRESRGLSINDLALQIGISPRQYYRYEAGEHVPKAATAQKLSIALDISMDQILAAVTK